MQRKVDFIRQPATTSSVAGLRRSSKALPKAKLAPKKNWGFDGKKKKQLLCQQSPSSQGYGSIVHQALYQI